MDWKRPFPMGRAILASRSGSAFARILLVIAASLGVALGTLPRADGRVASEDDLELRVKAAFLYNFAKFVTWPEKSFVDSKSPLVIGIVGDDPFKSVLDQTVGGKTVDGHQIQVKRFGKGDDLRACHILFVAASESERLDAILASIWSAPVLTVGDFDGFTRRGGIIRFYKLDNRIRFEIATECAKKVDLTISSQLLKVATIVAPAGTPKR
ncbi:MAG: YfiR family protein [Planctomycetes bacterium]|nr:YfiR family protein [Planctomycetota bacterium]